MKFVCHCIFFFRQNANHSSTKRPKLRHLAALLFKYKNCNGEFFSHKFPFCSTSWTICLYQVVQNADPDILTPTTNCQDHHDEKKLCSKRNQNMKMPFSPAIFSWPPSSMCSYTGALQQYTKCFYISHSNQISLYCCDFSICQKLSWRHRCHEKLQINITFSMLLTLTHL